MTVGHQNPKEFWVDNKNGHFTLNLRNVFRREHMMEKQNIIAEVFFSSVPTVPKTSARQTRNHFRGLALFDTFLIQSFWKVVYE